MHVNAKKTEVAVYLYLHGVLCSPVKTIQMVKKTSPASLIRAARWQKCYQRIGTSTAVCGRLACAKALSSMSSHKVVSDCRREREAHCHSICLHAELPINWAVCRSPIHSPPSMKDCNLPTHLLFCLNPYRLVRKITGHETKAVTVNNSI
jgi:hypothetical protein